MSEKKSELRTVEPGEEALDEQAEAIERDRKLLYAVEVAFCEPGSPALRFEIEDAFARLNRRALNARMVLFQPIITGISAKEMVCYIVTAQWADREAIEKAQRQQALGAMLPMGRGPNRG